MDRPVPPAKEAAAVRESATSLTSLPALSAPTVGREQGPASLGAMILAQTRAELRLALRRGESVLITLIIPPVLLVFFGLVDLMPIPPDRRADFLVPGILALAIMSTAMVSTGIATAFERYYKVLKRLGVSPLPRGGLLAAKIASILVIELLQSALIFGVAALLLEWRPAGSLLAVPLVLGLGTAAFGGLGLLMAGALRAEATLAVANGLYLVFLLLGGIVFPTSHLGPWLVGPAALLPSTALAETLRSVLGAGDVVPLTSWLVLSAWAILAPLAAMLTFRWE
jgi:ABC-2 type transport system permease protein